MNAAPSAAPVKINVSSLIQRASNLFAACINDREKLEAAGLKWSLVEEMALLVKECTLAEARWRMVRDEIAAETAGLRAFAIACEKFKNAVVMNLRAANQELPDIITQPVFIKNSSRPELIQDLHTLYTICMQNQEHLRKTSFPQNLGEQALERSNQLCTMHVNATLKRQDSDSLKCSRNALCNRLITIITEICALGRVVFRNEAGVRNYYCYSGIQ